MRNDVHAYATYKSCSISLIGEVPAHWEVKRLAQIGTFSKGGGGTKDDEVDHGLPCVRYGDIYTSHKYFVTHSRSQINPDRTPEYARMKYGDALFAGSGETIEDIGKSVVSLIEGEAYCGGDVILFRPTVQAHPRFMGYALDSPPAAFQKSSMGRGITIMHVYSSQLKNMCIPFPPLEEQAAIVRYLDHADELINRYISAKERLIALLEEQRKTVIHQAVTRGLHPNVSLTPSGIPSLGDVPAHWDLRRAKFTYQESDQRSYSGVEELMSVSHITGVTPRKQNVTMFLAQSNEGYKLCRPGDIVVNTMWAYMAALGVARQSGLVSPSYGVYRPRVDGLVNPEYMDLLLRTENYRVEYTRRSKGITASRLRLYPDDFLDIPFLRPPTDEQTHIVKYLRRATANVDSTIDRTHRQIALMNEYRTRLIADVVTGQIDVRDAAIDLPN